MNYYYKNKIVLSFSSSVCEKFLEYIKFYHFKRENGGIIVGILNPVRKRIVITDVTEPQKKDKCSSYRFKRDVYGHQEIMDQLWKESDNIKTYLGEWHTHNERIPKPSFVDRRNWINISKRKQNSDWLFFVIVGTQKIGIWTIEDGKIEQMSMGELELVGGN